MFWYMIDFSVDVQYAKTYQFYPLVYSSLYEIITHIWLFGYWQYLHYSVADADDTLGLNIW